VESTGAAAAEPARPVTRSTAREPAARPAVAADVSAELAALQRKFAALEVAYKQAQAPRALPAVKLDNFDGVSGDARQWIDRAALVTEGFGDADRIRYVRTHLADSAFEWASRAVASESTWQGFAAAFRARYSVVDDERAARDELRALRQTGKLSAYTAAFDMVVSRIPGLAQADLIHAYCFGLRSDLRAQVQLAILSEPTLDKAQRAAAIVDAASASAASVRTTVEVTVARNLEGGQDRRGQGGNRQYQPRHAASSKSPPSRDLSTVKCYNCGGLGHIRRDCSSPRGIGGTQQPTPAAASPNGSASSAAAGRP
jgi:hypothetical protein